MMTRIAKVLLVAGLALFHGLVAFNNITDFNSNYEFVRHVLAMDTTLPGNHGMWRALTSPAADRAFYLFIIGWEVAITILLVWGVAHLLRALTLSPDAFHAAKRIPMLALIFSMLLWLIAFLSIGGEWFLMWQSRTWNGQQEAFRMFTVVGLVFLILLQPETKAQP